MTMADHFHITGPALISFSGGRTSGYMLYQILQAHGGTLPDDIHVTFANTGKETDQTLDFIQDCEHHWSVPIHWLEFRPGDKRRETLEVNHTTASRNGEPFDMLIERKRFLPNPVMRYCTQELKIRVMDRYARAQGWDGWSNVIGLRADEKYRVAKARGRSDSRENLMPLADAGVTKKEVYGFWEKQNFNLLLPAVNGKTPMGNCDLCFLKGAKTIQALIRHKPELVNWWVDMEAQTGATFRTDRPSYAEMKRLAFDQNVFDFEDADELNECFCHD